MIKGAIFDMDGTLVDSMSMWRSIAKEIIENNGKEAREEFLDGFLHYSVDEAAEIMRRDFGVQKSADDLVIEQYECISRYYREDAKLKPGAEQILESLKGEGIKIAIATLNDMLNTKAVLEKYDLLKYFDHLITFDLVMCSKSDPKFFISCFDSMDIDADMAVFFEDSFRAGKTIKELGSFLCGLYDSTWPDENNDGLKEISDVYAKDLSHVHFENGKIFAF
ncbi:MAG: HAD family phosphatase [Eggerthellaceae bacterium]|nr:HAD family phosphatase [Eggerthellaceae bacterium]